MFLVGVHEIAGTRDIKLISLSYFAIQYKDKYVSNFLKTLKFSSILNIYLYFTLSAKNLRMSHKMANNIFG